MANANPISIKSENDLRKFLQDKPKEWSQIIALRSAMRVFPFVPDALSIDSSYTHTQLTVQVFRAILISWLARNTPTHEMTITAAYAADAAHAAAASADAAANAAYAARATHDGTATFDGTTTHGATAAYVAGERKTHPFNEAVSYALVEQSPEWWGTEESGEPTDKSPDDVMGDLRALIDEHNPSYFGGGTRKNKEFEKRSAIYQDKIDRLSPQTPAMTQFRWEQNKILAFIANGDLSTDAADYLEECTRLVDELMKKKERSGNALAGDTGKEFANAVDQVANSIPTTLPFNSTKLKIAINALGDFEFQLKDERCDDELRLINGLKRNIEELRACDPNSAIAQQRITDLRLSEVPELENVVQQLRLLSDAFMAQKELMEQNTQDEFINIQNQLNALKDLSKANQRETIAAILLISENFTKTAAKSPEKNYWKRLGKALQEGSIKAAEKGSEKVVSRLIDLLINIGDPLGAILKAIEKMSPETAEITNDPLLPDLKEALEQIDNNDGKDEDDDPQSV